MSETEVHEMLDRTAEMGDFFGVPLSKVNGIVLDLFEYEGAPSWLEGRWRLGDLPKYDRSLPGDYTTCVMGMPGRSIATRLRWIIETGCYRWRLGENAIIHETGEDQALFMLRFA